MVAYRAQPKVAWIPDSGQGARHTHKPVRTPSLQTSRRHVSGGSPTEACKLRRFSQDPALLPLCAYGFQLTEARPAAMALRLIQRHSRELGLLAGVCRVSRRAEAQNGARGGPRS